MIINLWDILFAFHSSTFTILTDGIPIDHKNKSPLFVSIKYWSAVIIFVFFILVFSTLKKVVIIAFYPQLLWDYLQFISTNQATWIRVCISIEFAIY